jgi:DNA-binding response OmpR family regulator
MSENAKILLIDDDADFVDSTRTVLQSKSYNVIVAQNGEEGLTTAKKEKPDLVLLDIIMPVKDGFTAAEQFKSDPELSKIPVLMLTSFSSKGGDTHLARSRGYSLETEDYIDKPVAPRELLARVEKHLKKLGK